MKAKWKRLAGVLTVCGMLVLMLCVVTACGSSAKDTSPEKEETPSYSNSVTHNNSGSGTNRSAANSNRTPSASAAASTPAVQSTAAEEEPAATEAEEPAEEPVASSAPADDEIRPEIKEAIDSYEDFIDEYCAFMETYDSSDTASLMEYMELLNEEVEMTEKFDAIEDEDLTDAETDYYLEVELRCSQKLLECAQNME